MDEADVVDCGGTVAIGRMACAERELPAISQIRFPHENDFTSTKGID
jgi:hypothetical protein